MEHVDKEYCLEIKGDFACFTRPELKVERMSYDVITPSAARAIFQAIFWKPAIQWKITRIEVLSPIQFYSILRNEVKGTMSLKQQGVFIEEKRTQRASYVLRDVEYRVFAKMIFIPIDERTGKCREESLRRRAEGLAEDENPKKYQEIFERRASNGQFFTPPYLGCREFSCSSIEWVPKALYGEGIDETRDLGLMFYDFEFKDHPEDPTPLFFRAKLEHGVVVVPQQKEDILR